MNEQVAADTADDILVQGIRNGDARSHERLVRRYSPTLYATALQYTKNDDDAADVLQDAIMKVIEHIHQYQGRSSLVNWMRSVTIREALQLLRRKKRLAEVSLDAAPGLADSQEFCLSAPADPSLQSRLEERETQAFVRRAVDELPESQREIILLRDIHGLSGREASDILGIKLSATKVRLHRARSALKKSIERCSDTHKQLPWQLRNQRPAIH